MRLSTHRGQWQRDKTFYLLLLLLFLIQVSLHLSSMIPINWWPLNNGPLPVCFRKRCFAGAAFALSRTRFSARSLIESSEIQLLPFEFEQSLLL